MASLTVADSAPAQGVKQTAPRLHLNYLDSLRALAAIYVVLYHAHTEISNDVPGSSHLVNQLMFLLSLGHYAVDLFIVLSGFCLMLPVARGSGTLRDGALTFYKKRARRILPTYYLALLLSLCFIFTILGQKTGTAWDTCLPADARNILMHLFLIQDLDIRTAAGINHALWSISVEWRIYFLFPVLVICWQRFGAFATTLVTVVASYILLIGLSHSALHEVADPTTIVGIMPQYLGLFAIGMLGAGIVFSQDVQLARSRTKLRWDLINVACLVAMAILSTKKIVHGHMVPVAYTDLVVGLWSMSLLIWASDGRNLLHRVLSWQPLVFIGTFAYSIYLVHAPLLQVFWQYVWHPLGLSQPQTLAAQCLVGMPAIIGISYLFYLLCERPFLNKPSGPRPPSDVAVVPS